MINVIINKITLFLFLAFIINKTQAQCFESIKKQNAFFIIFNDKKPKENYFCGALKKNKRCEYTFLKDNGKKFEYSFVYEKYRHIDDYYNDMNKSLLFKIDKSFIRKNKDIIITREFMEKMSKNDMLDLLYSDRSNKKIFMINTAETKNGKIVLREVEIDYTASE